MLCYHFSLNPHSSTGVPYDLSSEEGKKSECGRWLCRIYWHQPEFYCCSILALSRTVSKAQWRREILWEGRTLESPSGFLVWVEGKVARGTNPYALTESGYLPVIMIRDGFERKQIRRLVTMRLRKEVCGADTSERAQVWGSLLSPCLSKAPLGEKVLINIKRAR